MYTSGMLLYRDPIFRLHRQADGHPERPERLEAVERMLDSAPFASELCPGIPRDATEDELARVHSPAYIRDVAATAGTACTRFDGDTTANAHSFAAARRAAGSAIAAIDAILEGPDRRAFVLSRPPGHHAEATHAMGFCFFNNAAVAAEYALSKGLDRVCIIDWDVHHGNGSMHSFYDRPDVLYASVHQYPHFPGTGRFGDLGHDAGEGYTVSCPLPASCGDADYLHVLRDLVYPVAHEFCPDLVIVSAGYDAHRRDPLASMKLSSNVYGAFTALDCELADSCAGGRLLYLLEGGYDTRALSEGVHASLQVLTGSPTSGMSDTSADSCAKADASVSDTTRRLVNLYKPYWPTLERLRRT